MSVARLVAPQALLAWIRSVPVVMSSCYAKSASLCPEWPVGDVPRDMPPRHPGRLSGPPELPPGALGSCRQRFFPGLHVPAETFLFPYAGFVGLKVCTELPDSFFRMKGYAGAGPGLIQGHRVAGKTAGKLATTGKTVGKPGNRREKPRFWVTFASLNKGREWLGRASPASFFGPWGGVAIGGSFPGSTYVLSHPMGLAERGFAGF